MPALPKLSYVLLSHNREKYIRQALESAFAQDYEGELEYIISDDCSTDRTFDIIRECVANYKGGRRVVVTQTPRNLHLAGNTNHAMQFVESDWVVRADDDDIPTVDRCSMVGKAIAEHPEASIIFARFRTFTDDEEEEVQKWAKEHRITCSSPREQEPTSELFKGDDVLHMTWSAKWFHQFGPLPEMAYWMDDLITYYRCWCLGKVVVLDDILAFVRRGSCNMSRGSDDGQKGYAAILRLENFHERYHDILRQPIREELQCLRNYLNLHAELPACKQAVITAIQSTLRGLELQHGYWSSSTLHRLNVRRQMGRKGLFSLLRCLPLPVFAALMAIYRQLFRK